MIKWLASFLIFSSTFMAAPFVTTNFSKGRDLAEGHQLPLVLLFTGSDWSLESKALIQAVSRESIRLEMVIVQIDFPEINSQNVSLLQQNSALKEKYRIGQFPTILFLDSDENEVTRLGYPIQGVTDFTDYLHEIGRRIFLLKKHFSEAKQKRALEELKLCFDEARSLRAVNLIDEILNEGGEEIPELMLEKYIRIKGTKDAAILKAKLERVTSPEIRVRLALLDFQDERSLAPLEAFIEKFGQQAEDYLWQIHLIISEFLSDREEEKTALKHAWISYHYAPLREKEKIGHFISKLSPSESL